MLGTCGRINYSIDNDIVTKIIKRKCKSLSIGDQFKLHKFAFNIIIKNHFHILKIPKPINLYKKSYSMQKIDDSNPYYSQDSRDNKCFIKELVIFYIEFIKEGYYPNDYECFLQKDNSIYILDFDKFIKIDKINKLNQEFLLVGAFIPENFKQVFLEDPMVQ